MPNTQFPCPIGRRHAAALADMNIRSVITPDGLMLVARHPSKVASGSATNAVGPKHQVRDEMGRYVAYWVLGLEISGDLIDLEDDCWINEV